MRRSLPVACAVAGMAAGAFGAVPSTAGRLLWLDSSDSTAMTVNGAGRVTAWANKGVLGLGGVTWSGLNDNGTSAAYNAQPPALVAGPNGVKVVDFTRDGYLSNTSFSATPRLDLTIFVLAAVDSNPGAYSAVFATRTPGANDYQTGINMDQGEPSGASFGRINVEGTKAGGGGGFDLLADPIAFGSFHLFEISYGGGDAGLHKTISVSVDGVPRGSLSGIANLVNLNELYVGTRAYSSGGVPTANHDLDGKIAAMLIYDHQLDASELAQTRGYLNSFFQTYLDGDFNRDGSIDGLDLTILDNGFGHGLSGYDNGDMSRDGHIDRDDYTLWDRARAQFVSGINAPGTVGMVPEPGGVAVVAVGMALATGRRRAR